MGKKTWILPSLISERGQGEFRKARFSDSTLAGFSVT